MAPTRRRRGLALLVASLVALAMALTGTVTAAPAQAAVRAPAPATPFGNAIYKERFDLLGVIGTRTRTVYLQRRSGDGWRTIKKSVTAPNGAYSIRSTNTARPGARPKYRVYVRTSKGRLYSAPRTVPSVRAKVYIAVVSPPRVNRVVEVRAVVRPARPGRFMTIRFDSGPRKFQGIYGRLDANSQFATNLNFETVGRTAIKAVYNGTAPGREVKESDRLVVTVSP